MTSVWLFKPRSHGRKKEAARARNGAPLPGRLPSLPQCNELPPFVLRSAYEQRDQTASAAACAGSSPPA